MTTKTAAVLPSAPLHERAMGRLLALVLLGAGLSGCYPAGTADPAGSPNTAAQYTATPYPATPYPAAPYPSYGAPPPAAGAAAEVIPLIPHGRNFTVPVVINGAARIELLIDSGSTDVVLPAQAVLVMLRAGIVSESDFIGHAGYRLADGSVLVSPRLMLREVRVGNRVVRNVTASVGDVEGLPLLGQSFLSRVSSWAIDNNRHALILTGP